MVATGGRRYGSRRGDGLSGLWEEPEEQWSRFAARIEMCDWTRVSSLPPQYGDWVFSGAIDPSDPITHSSRTRLAGPAAGVVLPPEEHGRHRKSQSLEAAAARAPGPPEARRG